MEITLYDLAARYIGQVIERKGDLDHPLVQWWLSLCGFGLDSHDEIAWCSAFMNGIAFDLNLPRTKSAMARSWLNIGIPIQIEDAKVGFDIVIFKRGTGVQPGPEVLNAPGHVALFAGLEVGSKVLALGGNTANGVGIGHFDRSLVLGVRRLYTEEK